MSFVRKSKYRHVFGRIAKPENQYLGMKSSTAQLDSSIIKVNGKYVSYIMAGTGGGRVAVFPIDKVGRHTVDPPVITGHTRPVIDMDFSPFDSEVIATASEDLKVRVFKIPESGIPEGGLNEPCATLEGHSHKVMQVLWNPAASGILASCGQEKVIRVWDVENNKAAYAMEGIAGDTIQDFQWNQTGNLLGFTCRDKKLRLYDARASQVVLETAGFEGAKTSKLVFNNTRNQIISVGFGKGSNRELHIHDQRAPEKPLFHTNIDQASGVLTPFFDEATQILFICGKGEQNIRYYEITDEKPHCFFIATCQEGSPQRGITWLPKRFVDTTQCEIARFYRLTAKDTIEPISMIVPRTATSFQEDIYPPVVDSLHASMTSKEWLEGKNTPRKYFAFTADGSEKYIDASEVKNAAADVDFKPVAAAAAPAGGNKELEAAKAKIAQLEKENAELKETIKKLEEQINQA